MSPDLYIHAWTGLHEFHHFSPTRRTHFLVPTFGVRFLALLVFNMSVLPMCATTAIVFSVSCLFDYGPHDDLRFNFNHTTAITMDHDSLLGFGSRSFGEAGT